MHVLVTTDTLGSIWTYTRELVTGLTTSGVRVTLVSFGDIPMPEQTRWMDDLRGLDYRPTAFHLDWMLDGERDHQDSSAWLAALTREIKPDLLHLNHPCHGSLAVKLPKVVVAHSDPVTWWLTVHGREPKDAAWLHWYKAAVARGILQASVVVAPSYWMLDQTRENYARGQHGAVIYHGRNPLLFNPHLSKENAVLAVGDMLDAGKQVALLTHHAHLLPISIVGSEGPAAAQSFIRADVKLAVEPICLAFKGAQTEPQMRMLYARSSIFAATAQYDPCGLDAMEAAFSRCAIVASDVPVHRELWGDAAIYFRANDSGSLTQVLADLSARPDQVTRHGNRAYLRSRENFTAKRMVEEYVSLYRSLVAGAGRGTIAA